MVLDELAGRMGGKFKTHKARAQVLEGRLGIGGPRVVLSKPMSYMNVSGGRCPAWQIFTALTLTMLSRCTMRLIFRSTP
ncbi:peptidyl-tRNA hydrolase [Arthrobacter sp. Hiyo4]|nr:peptidyl-tRNA hydrolase [Arthrobacter sp. Hiyo4]